MSIKKIFAAMMMGAALVTVSPAVDVPPCAMSVAHAQDVWAYSENSGGANWQYYVMSETVKRYSDGGINVKVKLVRNGQGHSVKTYNFMPRYYNDGSKDWKWSRQTAGGWEDLGFASNSPLGQSVINVCLRYV